MQRAIEQEKTSKNLEKKRVEGINADAVADQIMADEEVEEARTKKKKKQGKKKGKK
jgi:hypothetical protein